jgi:protein TonB
MAYAQKKELSGNRTLAIIIVAVLQFALGYAIVTGLAYNVIKKASENLKTFDVEEQPPPPEEPPPPPPKNVPDVPPPPVAMKPIVQAPIQSPVQIVTTPTPQPAPIHIQAPPAPPPPPPPPAKVTKAQSAKGNLQSLFSGDDYPPDAQRNEEEGTVVATLTIGTDGRVENCSVTKSSGSRSLDSATCRILRSRARYTPARLSNGQPTTDTDSARITWRLAG